MNLTPKYPLTVQDLIAELEKLPPMAIVKIPILSGDYAPLTKYDIEEHPSHLEVWIG